jgi:hypothetical protein
MRIPKLTAEFSVGAATGVYRHGPAVGGPAAVAPMATLSCLSACVGPSTAARCAAQCADAADSQACWQQCSGTADPGCLRACFRS